MITSNKHIHNIPNDVFIYVLNPLIDSTTKFKFYTASKHLSSLIPLTTIDSFTYTVKTRETPTPNIFKNQNSHTFKVEEVCFWTTIKDKSIDLPSCVKKVNFFINDLFPNLSNSNVKNITFGNSFNHSLNGLLPKTLEILRVGHHFNKLICTGDLPNTLHELYLGDDYSYPLVPGLLPLSLKNLRFKYKQNYCIVTSKWFPPNLEHLYISWGFSSDPDIHIDDECYSSKLLTLELTNNYSDVIDVSKLPRTLESLTLADCKIKRFYKGMLPPILKKLFIGTNISLIFDKSMFPESLEEIILCHYTYEITKDTFHDSLKKLKLGYGYNRPLRGLPNNLEKLIFLDYDYELLPNVLPNTLKHLHFTNEWNHPLSSEILPASLESIHFGEGYTQSLSNVLTHCYKLETLSLGVEFNQPLLPGMLPSSLKYLTLSYDYNKPLELKSLPENLLILQCGQAFNQPILPGVLPNSLKKLIVGSYFKQKLEKEILPKGLKVLVMPEYATGRFKTIADLPFDRLKEY
jgi:hypothetical protein